MGVGVTGRGMGIGVTDRGTGDVGAPGEGATTGGGVVGVGTGWLGEVTVAGTAGVLISTLLLGDRGS